MQVLVDSSVWIDYFRTGESSSHLDMLIDENLIVTNDIILAELIPFLKMKKQYKLIGQTFSSVSAYYSNCLEPLAKV